MSPVTRVETPSGGIGSPRYVDHGIPAAQRVLRDGTVVSTGPGAIFEWELATRRLIRTTWFRDGLGPVKVSLDGDVFFTAGGVLHAWRRATGSVEACLTVKEPRVSADGTHVAHRVGGRIEVVRLADRKPIASVAPVSNSFDLAHGGRWLLFTNSVSPQSGSGWVEVAVVSTADETTVLSCEPFGDDAAAFLSGDGLAVEFDGSRHSQSTVALDTTTPRVETVRPAEGPRWRKGAVPFAIGLRGHPLLWTGATVERLTPQRIWDEHTDELDVRHAALSCDGTWLAMLPWHGDGAIQCLDKPVRNPLALPPNLRPRALGVTARGGVVIASLDGVRLPDGRTVKLPKTAWDSQLALSHDARVIAVSGHDSTDPLFVITDGAVTATLEPRSTDDAPRAFALSPDGARLAASTWAGLEVWDVGSRARVSFIEGAPLFAALAYSRDGELFACRHDTTVHAF